MSLFADNITLYCKIKPLKKCETLLEKSIATVQNKLKYLGLDPCANKTVLLHFNKNNIPPDATVIVVDNVTIKSSSQTRFLGIIFDYHMTFLPHVNDI